MVEDFGGTVPQILGDGFMAVFGVPVAHEDDAERAVCAALAVRDHVRRLNAARKGPRLPEVHAGVNSGEVLVGRSDEPSGFAVIGDTVNTASRLADLAPGGRIFVDVRSRNRTAHAIRYGPRRTLRAKGKPEPLAVYEALGALDRPSPARSGGLRQAGFVNRQDVFRRLEEELRAVRLAKRSRVLLLTGEPGIGKSRLAAEFGRRLSSVTLLSGRCLSFGQRLPLHALAEAVGEAAGVRPEAPGQSSEDALGGLAARVARGDAARSLVRDLHVLLGTGSLPAGVQRGTVHDAIRAARTLLQGLSRKQPLIVVLDDLHWADQELLRLLEDVDASPWDGQLLFLGFARPEPFAERLPTVELEALATEDMRTLATHLLGEDIPQDVLASPLGRAGGNPLFLEESIEMLVEAGVLAKDAGRWRVTAPDRLGRVPSKIRLLIAARLDGLPPDEKRVVQHASVAGEITWDRLVESFSGVPHTRPALQALEARGLLHRKVVSQIPGAAEYEFKHVLIREVAYESLPRGERAVRHLQVARWFREGASVLPEEPVAALAHHYERAWFLSRSRTGPPPDPDTAGLAAEYLGRWADRTFTYQARSAEALFRRALQVADEARSAVKPSLRATLLIGRAEALTELGRHREAVTVAVRAREWATRSGEQELIARALLARGRAESDLGRPELARGLLDRALALFEAAGDVRGQGWALHRLSETWAIVDYGLELDHLRRAYELFARSKDRWGQTTAAQDLAYLHTTIGGDEFHRWYEESRRLTQDEADVRSRAALLRTWGYFTFYRGRYEEAIRVMREARPLAVEAGDRYAEADALLIESMAACLVGPPEAAGELAREALRLGRDLDSGRVSALALLASARCAVRCGKAARAAGKLGAATRILDRPARARVEMIERNLWAAGIHLDRGSFDQVPASAARMGAEALASGWKLWEPLAPLLTGRALLGAGRPEEAASDLGRAVDLARGLGADGTQALAEAANEQANLLVGRPRPVPSPVQGDPEVQAVLSENAGLRALAVGDPASAADSLGSAVERWRRIGATAWLARALAMWAEAHRRAGSGRRAGPLVREARALLDALKTPSRNRPQILSPIPEDLAE